jgi:hypothetical protein
MHCHRNFSSLLIFGTQARRSGNREKLMKAIDYVEEMTGDRTTLHAKSAPIG